MEAKTSSKMSEVFGRLLAGSFIYEAEENRSSNIKRLIAKTKKWVGEDDFKMILNSSTENLKAPIFACIDMATIGKLTQDTKELFKGLEPANRIIMENLYLKFTGQDPFDQKDRWDDTLWKFKTSCRKYIELSPTEVKEEELASVVKELAIPFMENMQKYFQKIA